ncbi:MAG: MBL fold metallo-hydrolase [Gammaproteobacteria bacterium]|nr:MBL fold metallo-hydrolase [Gammaproteobacteria bacterium]
MTLRATIVPVTAFQQNCSIVWSEETHEGAVIDPGGDLEHILAAADDEGVILRKILLTHAHIDHAGATQALAEMRGLPIEGPHPDDQFWIDMLPEQARSFGFKPVATFTPTRWLAQGDTVRVGPETLEVLHCPGHTPGHVVFYSRPDRLAFVGDVLFAGSIGRTDFPRGDHATLVHSITSNLWPLGNDVTFVPGHGPTSTFGQERATNPFVGDRIVRPGSRFGD